MAATRIWLDEPVGVIAVGGRCLGEGAIGDIGGEKEGRDNPDLGGFFVDDGTWNGD